MTFTFILHYLMGAVSYPFLIFMYFGIVLTPKKKKKPFWFYAVMVTILVQPINIGRMADENSIVFAAMAWIQLAFIIAFVFIFFQERPWEKILMVILWSVTSIVSEIILSASIGDKIQELDFTGDDPVAMIYEIVIYIITFTILGLIGVAWKLVKRRNVPRNIWIFLLFPISQYLMVCNSPMDTYTGEVSFQYPWYTIFGLLIGVAADVILFYVMFSQGEKEKIKQQLEETEKLIEMEKSYYETVKQHQEEIAKIRHDFGNQLTVALHIAQSGGQEKAVDVLEQLQAELEVFTKDKWCENSVVNAVLSEKSRVCEKEKIHFAAQVDVSGEIGIQPLHLCSILANLLDNAISAAGESGEECAQVSLYAKQQERYLVIKVENTSEKPEKKVQRPGHGYGLQILRSIAEQYNGNYSGSWENGLYTAVVIMEFQ